MILPYLGQLPLMKVLTHYDMIELANDSMVRHLRTESMTRTEGMPRHLMQTQLALCPYLYLLTIESEVRA